MALTESEIAVLYGLSLAAYNNGESLPPLVTIRNGYFLILDGMGRIEEVIGPLAGPTFTQEPTALADAAAAREPACPILSPGDEEWLGNEETPGAGAFVPESGLITFSLRDVQPTPDRFVAGGDQMRFRVFTSLASATVHFRGRYLVPVGSQVQMTPFAQSVIATSAGGGTTIQPIQNDGFVAQLAASVDDATIESGDVYVVVEAGRGEGSDFRPYQLLLSGNVTVLLPLSSAPGGSVSATNTNGRLVTDVADPAAGAQVFFTVPQGSKWRLQSFTYSLTTSATVANRECNMVIDDGTSTGFADETGVYAAMVIGDTQTAGTSRIYRFVRGANRVIATVSVNRITALGDWYVVGGDRIRSHVSGIQAGDQISSVRVNAEVVG